MSAPTDIPEDLTPIDEDQNLAGAYNMEVIQGGKRSLSTARPVPVFGMRHVSWQGADLNACLPEPRSKKLTESEIRELMVRHGLDTMGMIAELRRLIQIGALDMTPENIKKLVDSEKGNAEVILRALDVDNKMPMGDSRTIALQIINNVTNVVDKGFSRARQNMDANPVIEASVVAIKHVGEAARALPEPDRNADPADPIAQILSQPDELEAFVAARRQ